MALMAESGMDIVFLAGGALLWGLSALLVLGLRRLERPQRDRS